jgi:hypothetical protein
MADDKKKKIKVDDVAKSEPAADDHDVVLVHGRTEDGLGLRALRSRPGKLESAEIRQVEKGKPIHGGDVVSLKSREESPLLWDVDVQYSPDEQSTSAGPPKVSSDRYRANWDTIFGKKRRKRLKKKAPDKRTLN